MRRAAVHPQTSLLLSAVSPLQGERFLSEVARQIGEALGVSDVFIAERTEADTMPPRIRVLAHWSERERIVQLEFRLAGTPCEQVYDSNLPVFFPKGVSRLFPGNGWLDRFGAESYYALPLLTGDGAVIGHLALLSGSPIKLRSDVQDALVSVARRVASELERKVELEAVRRSEAHFRRLVDNATDVVYFFRLAPELKLEYVSPSVEALTGYAREAFEADSEFAFEVLHPDDRPWVKEAFASAPATIRTRVVRRDGRIIWIDAHQGRVCDRHGEVIGVAGIVRDVTSQIEMEGTLERTQTLNQALTRALSGLVLRVSREGVLREVVAGPETGLDLPPGLVGRSLDQVISRAVARDALAVIARVLASGAPEFVGFDSDPSTRLRTGGETSQASRRYQTTFLKSAEDEVLIVIRDAVWQSPAADDAPAMVQDAAVVTAAAMRNDDAEAAARERDVYGLTRRELSVLEGVARGEADKQIAGGLGISPFTVNRHVAHILAKMRASSRTEAGVRAVRERLLRAFDTGD